MPDVAEAQPRGTAAEQETSAASLGPSADTIKKLKELSDLGSSCLGMLLKGSVPVGGAILLVYAAKEGFFYDTSSIAAVSVLVFVSTVFAAVMLFTIGYGAVCFIWLTAFALWLGRRRPNRKFTSQMIPWLAGKGMAWFSFFMLCILAIGLYAGWRAGNPIRFQDVAFVSLAGFLIIGTVGVRTERNDAAIRTDTAETETLRSSRAGVWSIRQRALSAISLPLVLLSSIYHDTGSHFLNLTMILLSFRSEPPQLVLI